MNIWQRLKALVFGVDGRDKKAPKGARKARKAKAAPKAKAPKEKAEKAVNPKPAKAETKAKAPQVKDGGAKGVKEVKAKGGNEVPADARLLALATWAGGQTGDSRLVEIVGRRLAALRRHEKTLGAYRAVCARYADMVEALDPGAATNRLKAGWWDWVVLTGYAGDFTPPRSLRGRVQEVEEVEHD